jgi:hypothetical protein
VPLHEPHDRHIHHDAVARNIGERGDVLAAQECFLNVFYPRQQFWQQQRQCVRVDLTITSAAALLGLVPTILFRE